MIQRCQDRIKDRIMPQIWEYKLKNYQNFKQKVQKLIGSEPQGLSTEVITRLKRLELVKKGLMLNGDEYNSLPSIEAIMSLYRSGDYKWEQGKATFWLKGKRIAGPVDFDCDKFLGLSSQYNPTGRDGFWVELVSHSVNQVKH